MRPADVLQGEALSNYDNINEMDFNQTPDLDHEVQTGIAKKDLKIPVRCQWHNILF